MNVKGKKLLVLGGGTASLDLVINAKEMGVYTIVTDYLKSGVAKDIADESLLISTADIDSLEAVIKEKSIDGVFCGPSEFNLRNVIKLCEKTGLPCYTDMATWNRCANKDEFKSFCIKNNVDCPRPFLIDENSSDEELDKIDYPVIVKPVDGSSSRGITVCYDKTTVRNACLFAKENSTSKKIIVEKYIENAGEIFGVRYIVDNGEAYPYLLLDSYILDPNDKNGLISNCLYTPSKYSDYYMTNMDSAVREMIKDLGIKNGTAFFQALPYDGKIYIHEMGYRLSGGMLFKFTVPLIGINDMKMMIRFALGDTMCTKDEVKLLKADSSQKTGVQYILPLSTGKIASIEGLEDILFIPCLQDFIQYYHVGDEITEEYLGTLSQHFGRFTFVADDVQALHDAITKIDSTLKIKNDAGELMNIYKFDLNRIR